MRVPEGDPDAGRVDDQALELRSHGGSYKSIADTLGLEKSGAAIRAFNRALRRRPPSEQESLLADELQRLDRMEAKVRANTELEAPEAARRLRAIVRIRAMVSAA